MATRPGIRYAALHAQAYGEAVDATTLAPHMLEAFRAGDRGFKKESPTKAAALLHARASACVAGSGRSPA